MKNTTRKLFDLHGKNLYRKVDGYLYLKYLTQYVGTIARALNLVNRIINESNKFLFLPIIRFLTNRYHGKIMIGADAHKIIRLDRDVSVPTDAAKSVIPYEKAFNIIFRNPDSIVAVDCSCRKANGHDCQPATKCMIIGEPFASFVMEHNRSANPVKLSREEALDLVDTCRKNGYVSNAYFKDGAGNGMYAICNCCPECCVSIKAHRMFDRVKVTERSMARSGYLAAVDAAKCGGKGVCATACPFGAISLNDGGKAVIDPGRCMGCATCAGACPDGAIAMHKTPDQGIPLDIHELVPASRNR